MRPATSIGRRRTRRDLLSSAIFFASSAYICMDARCTRRGGPALAAHAIQAGLVDEYQLLVVPTMLGGGKRVLPSNVCIRLDLLAERVLLMEWSIFAITRRPNRGCRSWFRALIALPTKALNFEE